MGASKSLKTLKNSGEGAISMQGGPRLRLSTTESSGMLGYPKRTLPML